MKPTKKKSKTAVPASRKLIDRLVSRDGALLAFLGTTYELDAEFLETDFLPSLLGLGAWDDRNWTSRIEIEKHLAGAEAVAIFLDKACYRARPRSLRVGTFPVDAKHGRILHAKVTLLVYADAVRLIVGSANLTAPGYRKNREVAATLRVTVEDQAHASLIRQALVGLQSHLAEVWNDSAERAANLALAKLDEWRVTEDVVDECWFAWSGSSDRPLWQQVIERWPSGERAQRISIVSPFWSEETGDGPIAQLIHLLKDNDQLVSGARVRLFAEARPVANGTFLPVLPESFGSWNADSLDVLATVAAVDPAVLPEEVDGMEEFKGIRKLHAKIVLIEGPTTTLAYLGSANFTNRGWGFERGRLANLEAGIVQRATGKDRERLSALLPGIVGPEVALDGAVGERLVLLPGVEPTAPWPGFVRALTLVPNKQDPLRLALEVIIVPDEVQGAWTISLPSDDARILAAGGSDAEATSWVELEPELLERVASEQEVMVRWWAHAEGTRFPVNVSLEARGGLPIAPGVARPGEHLLLSYYQGRISWEALFPEPSLDAHAAAADVAAGVSEVDTSKIQAYQVREFVEALQGIRDDLKAASSSPATMRLALLGPVSPVALAQHVAEAVARGTRSPTAGAFQLVEIIGQLDEAAKAPVEREQPGWIGLLAQARARVEALLVQVQSLHPDRFPPDGPFRKFQRSLDRFHRPEVES
jgi:hypothetical protein